ncbi:hypothetical protein ACIPW5_05995 [Streptomyces sp. NPDC090077]|uniref:hypothetical protein n=1 Tax=Streptomyces sp. NPDC090077 TaxID=3365938 RepID=UPI00380AE9D6
MIPVTDDGWSFATAREPARFAACEVHGAPGVDHAAGPRGTLCGIAARHTTTRLHLFEPGALQSCLRCRTRAAAAPSEPCAQERLHRRVRDAAEGAARDDLLAALLRGAEVGLWVNGPSGGLAEHYAGLDALTDGAGPAAAAFGSAASIGLARVEDGPWRFVVVLPEDGGRPLVARGPR